MAQIGDDAPRSASRAVLIYNTYRLGLLLACLGIGWLATLRGIVLIVAALALSGVLSWFLLRAQRIAMGIAIEQTVERSHVRTRMAERTAAEDGYVDSMLASRQSRDEKSVGRSEDPSSS